MDLEYSKAQKLCEIQNSSLVLITSDDEKDFVVDLARKNHGLPVWIGLGTDNAERKTDGVVNWILKL